MLCNWDHQVGSMIAFKGLVELTETLDLVTGFSRQLIESIVSCVKDINSIEMVLQRFNFFDGSQAKHL